MANYCHDCETPTRAHFFNWMSELLELCMPTWLLKIVPKSLARTLDRGMERVLVFVGLASFDEQFAHHDIQPRSACFMREAKSRGATCAALKGPAGYNNRFRISRGGEELYFEGLPLCGSKNTETDFMIDDKKLTKDFLQKNGFPVADGNAFWFWQRKKALEYVNAIGFPLVVKPRNGSLSRHVTTNIQNNDDLGRAIKKSLEYGPTFIVEKFLENSHVYRMTVIDENHIFCARRAPAHIVGNGTHAISELIQEKNDDPMRRKIGKTEPPYHAIVFDEESVAILAKKGMNLASTPRMGEKVMLHHDPFWRLGGDYVDETDNIHPENKLLARRVARALETKVIAIDFMAEDIALPWQTQECAIIELNSLPSIDIHHFTCDGVSRNVAGTIWDAVEKYHFS